MKKIFVGNLPFNVTEPEVRELFEAHGVVNSVNLISDRETGRPRGFGFVDMPEEDAIAAIQALDNVEFGGRRIHVNEARDKQPRHPRRGR